MSDNNSPAGLIDKAKKALTQKRYEEACRLLTEALARCPADIELRHLLGIACFESGKTHDALRHFETAAQNSNSIKIRFNYASVLLEVGHYSKALKAFNRVLALDPEHIPTLNKCIAILGKMGELSLAEKMCSLVIKRDPASPDAYNNMGNLCKDQGNSEAAITRYRKALSLCPEDTVAASNLLLSLNYRNRDPQAVFNEHRAFEKRIHTTGVLKPSVSQSPAPDKSPLNIGYVSADFRIHSVGYFIEPIIRNHDQSRCSIFCYADIAAPDEITKRIQKSVTKWRNIYNVADKEIIKMIQEDNIDILVDLAGHCGDNNLPVFLNKPAPVQVTYLGYPNTTGLTAMDYRITDERADPSGSGRYYTETLIRLPHGFLCYKPPEDIPEMLEPPVTEKGFVTFGSFNNLAKVSHETISTWSQILKAIPKSKLVIKAKSFNDAPVLTIWKEKFTSHGIDENRLLFIGHLLSTEEHLSTYNCIDIALDTFPYNGTTTTCESLLMGTPVITLLGDRHAGRVGNSILTQINLTNLIADNEKTYIEIASRLSKDIPYLIQLNQSLRKTLLQSSLCSGAAFTKTLEKAYREMWRDYCASRTDTNR